MGTTKSNQFTSEQNKLADLFKALAHPARIAILQVLIKKQSCICGDIVDELPLSQSTISQHLNELKKVGIIKGEITGVKTCYCINTDVFSITNKELSEFFLEAEKCNSENCC